MKTKTETFGTIKLTISEEGVVGSVTKEEAIKAIEDKAKKYGSELNIPAMYNCFLWKSAVELKYRQINENEVNEVKNYILEVVGKAFEKGILYHVLDHVLKSEEGKWSDSFKEAAAKYL
jgi:hypothetical protein